MERKIFLRVFLLLSLLLFNFTDVFTSETPDEDHADNEAEVPQENSISSESDDQHQIPLLESSCSCLEEIKALRELLDELRREFTYQKETEIHRQHGLEDRIQIIFQGIRDNQTEKVNMQMKYIQEHILDDSILQRISESLWTRLQSNPNTSSESIRQFYTKLLEETSPALYLPIFQSWFNYLEESDKLTDVEALSLIMRELELTLRKSKPIQLSWWTKETETFFLNRIHSHILSLLASIEPDSAGLEPNIPSVHDRETFRTSDVTTAFSRLSKLEVYAVIVDTFESELAGELLSSQQLQYFLNKIYASSTTISRYFEELDDLYTKEEWTTWKRIFGKKYILDSIVRDILSKVTPDETDAATIGLQYLRNWSSIFDFYGNPEDDILFAHIAEVFLHAIQNNVMTYDPLSPNYWKLIEMFQRAPEVILKYSFLVDDVKAAVAEKYDNNLDNLFKVAEFTKGLSPTLKYPALKQFITSVRENGHLKGIVAFQVGSVLIGSGLETDPIWAELPEQVTLLMGSSNERFLWRVKAPSPDGSNKLYEIVGHSDFSIGLYPAVDGEGGTQDAPEDSQRTWTFKPSGSKPVKASFQLADLHFRGGLILAKADNGTQFTRHVQNSRDRKYGMYTLFTPKLTEGGDSFNLIRETFDEATELQVLYDELSVPFNLGIGTPTEIARIADFVVSKAP
ncbi:unnamed protein product [Allacma fusca]|uniref:Uncharacterized protein n=1 Tax=Allacma fusca TaxID=39272 RepID=A0A8J2J4W5_9HEXA|nr:unnamed protein product [Allacma fusca]